MRKSHHVVVLSLSLALAGCGADHPPATTEASKAKPAATAAGSASQSAKLTQPGMDSVLKAISGKAATSVRYDKVVQTQAGSRERQVFVEMLGASTAQTEALATKALVSSGFSVHRGKDDANGVRIQYRKVGAEPVNALIRDKKASPPLKEGKATSSLYLKQKVL